MSRHFRIGIIGVGGIAALHARAISDLPGAELVAGVCRTEAKGRKFAQEFGGQWFSDYEQMMDQVRPDVVCIATPSGAHLEPTLAAARRGIHVICEKPLEITTERIDRMIAACREAGVVLGGIFPMRFHPAVLAIREAVTQGRFGPLSLAGAYVPWWRDDSYYASGRWQGTQALDGGGALMNQSSHDVDALQWVVSAAPELSGEDAALNPVKEVFALTAKRGRDPKLIEVEDTAVAVLRFRNGALGQLLGATSMYPGTDRRLWIAGRGGTVELHGEEMTTFQFRDELPEDAGIREQFFRKTRSSGASNPLAISHIGHTRNIGSILQAITEGSRPAIDGHEARKAVAILEALYASARQGVPVQVG